MTTDAPRCDNCDRSTCDVRSALSDPLLHEETVTEDGYNARVRLVSARNDCDAHAVDWRARALAAEARAVTPETVIALLRGLHRVTGDDLRDIIGRHRPDVEDEEASEALAVCDESPLRFSATYDGPGADAIKHDLARLVMERAGIEPKKGTDQ